MMTREQSIKYYNCTQHGTTEQRKSAYDVRWQAMPVLAVDNYHAHVCGPGRMLRTIHSMWHKYAPAVTIGDRAIYYDSPDPFGEETP